MLLTITLAVMSVFLSRFCLYILSRFSGLSSLGLLFVRFLSRSSQNFGLNLPWVLSVFFYIWGYYCVVLRESITGTSCYLQLLQPKGAQLGIQIWQVEKTASNEYFIPPTQILSLFQSTKFIFSSFIPFPPRISFNITSYTITLV